MNREQFMEKVYPEPNTGCWIWAGRTDNKGYGRLSHRDTFQVAHRFSYFIHKGDFDTSKHLLHTCDNAFCVNPDHLYLGDQRQNNIDRDKRGRQKTKRGSSHKLAKLNEEASVKIREIHNPKTFPTRKLAKMFGVSQCVIMKVIKGSAWKHTL